MNHKGYYLALIFEVEIMYNMILDIYLLNHTHHFKDWELSLKVIFTR